MINNVLSDLLLYRQRRTADLIDKNSISFLLQSEPQNMTPILSYIFGMKEQVSILNFLTGGMGRTIELERDEYDWDVMIESRKPVTINSAKWQGATIASTDVPGINGTPIQVWVSEKFFGPGAILEFDDNKYQAIVYGEPYQDGSEWVYTLQVSDGKADSYIPPSLLASGKQLSRAGSAYPEYSEEADIIEYQSPTRLRNYLTIMRRKADITGSAASETMVIEMRDPETGATTKYWDELQKWNLMRQWYETMEYQLVYDKCTVDPITGTINLKGSNGRPIKKGAGLLQQISPANRRTYTKLTADLLEEFLFDLSYGLNGFGERKYVALTGEMGMKELDRVLREKVAALGVTIVDTKFITGTGQELALGGQFTTYNMLNGVQLTLKHFPLYDDTYHHRKLHPVTKKPLESYRMTFVDIGMKNGEANVNKVVKKGREMVMWAVGGALVPGQGFSSSFSNVMSNSRDGVTIEILGEAGIWVKYPNYMGELVLDAE